MKAFDILGFSEKRITLIGYPLAGFLISVLLFNDQIISADWERMRVSIPLAFFFTGIFWVSMRFFMLKSIAYYPASNMFGKRMLLMLGAFFFTYFVVNGVAGFIILQVVTDVQKPNFFMELIGSFLVSALVIFTFETMRFSTQLKAAELERATLLRQNVESQLEGLRNQVNPHFLFNSLNTLTYLIPDDQEKAVRFVQQLSRVYRYILDSRNDKIIPIQEELDFLESYIFLLRERFGENIRIEMHDLCDGENCAIVPLSLQMLFENAIKHNVISKSQPLDIQVFVKNHGSENEAIIVQNTLQRKTTISDSTGVGLENIADRYRILTGKSIRVEEGDGLYRVSSPLIRMGAV